jgi:hypothetical protein
VNTYIVKSVLVLVCVTVLSMPTPGQKGKGGGGSPGGSACADIATPTLSTTTSSPGTNVGVFSRVTNCSTGRQRFTVTISAVSSCGQETVIASALVTLNAGESKLISVSYPIAPGTCAGTSTVSVSASASGTVVGSQSTSLTIQ